MKIILLQDVKNIGKKDATVEVNDGYANNYLIPRKLAIISTPIAQANLARMKERKLQELEKEKTNAIKTKEILKNITLEFVAKASPDGRMLGTISYKQIEEELKNKFNVIIDKRRFIDKYQINAFGYTRLKIELFKDVIGVVNVHVSENK